MLKDMVSLGLLCFDVNQCKRGRVDSLEQVRVSFREFYLTLKNPLTLRSIIASIVIAARQIK